MRRIPKIPRILKINRINGQQISVVFNNGQSRIIDFEKVFSHLHFDNTSPVFKLKNPKYFRKAKINNHTLSWDNVDLFTYFKGEKIRTPFEVGADMLYKMSKPDPKTDSISVGAILKKERRIAGLTQQELAEKSGTTRTYISKIENDASGIEISTLEKIIQTGLGKRLEIIVKA